MSLSKILLNQDQSYDESSFESLLKIESFIIDTYGTRDPDVTQIFTPSKNLKISKNFTIDLGVFKRETNF
jgi:hypothetical protein